MNITRALELRTLYSQQTGKRYDNLAGAIDLAIRFGEYDQLTEDEAGLMTYLDSKCTVDEATGKRTIKDEFFESKQISTGRKDKKGKPVMRTIKVLKVQ